jgi:hypothetical protein
VRSFFSAAIATVIVATGEVLGFRLWEDMTAGVIIGSLASGPVTARLWDGKRRKPTK